MKKLRYIEWTLFICTLVIFSTSCSGATYKKSTCQNYEEISQTKTLYINDVVPLIKNVSTVHSEFSLEELKGSYFLFYFKKGKRAKIWLDDEIKVNKLGRTIVEKGGHLLVFSELKAAKIFGIEMAQGKERWNILYNTLLITDGRYRIVRIYKNICEDQFLEVISKIQEQ